jgi:CRISPR/Cas system CMR subunit Cmr6 (Cas7 group RAMP superfamily)
VPVLASSLTDFYNDREMKSLYQTSSNQDEIRAFFKKINPSQIKNQFSQVIKDTTEGKECSFDIQERFIAKLKEINPKVTKYKGAFLHLREENLIDDIVAKKFLESLDWLNKKIQLPKNLDELDFPYDQAFMSEAISIVKKSEQKLKRSCLDEVFNQLYSEVSRIKGFRKSYFEAVLFQAVENREIEFSTYSTFEKARLSQLEKSPISLKSYLQKKRSLRLQFPLRDMNERNDYVTLKTSHSKSSYRQYLYENYTDIQIMLMSAVIKKLRARLESPKVEILIYDQNQHKETILLAPMERFRLAIKLLRKEMTLLSQNTYFNGQSPSYSDLMTAAYETSTIASVELEEVLGLEDIWNPKKSFWQKAQVWVSSLSSVATIVIPPPYGFVPALALVVIEMTSGKKDEKNEDPTILF